MTDGTFTRVAVDLPISDEECRGLLDADGGVALFVDNVSARERRRPGAGPPRYWTRARSAPLAATPLRNGQKVSINFLFYERNEASVSELRRIH